ncbi:MAG: SDR family oxidoreductase [Pseudomonadota bacterium]
MNDHPTTDTAPDRATARPVALITGASRGLGAGLALSLAETHHIVAVARTTGALEELDDQIRARGGESTLAPMDITVDAAMAQLCRSIFDRWRSVDIWAHTAVHAAPLSPAANLELKDFSRSVEVNVTATARLIGFVSPLLAPASRALFFDDSRGGSKFFASYGASKSAQLALARSWQAETENTGPRVHIMSPRAMNTATRARFFPGEDRSALPSPLDEAKRLLDGLA